MEIIRLQQFTKLANRQFTTSLLAIAISVSECFEEERSWGSCNKFESPSLVP